MQTRNSTGPRFEDLASLPAGVRAYPERVQATWLKAFNEVWTRRNDLGEGDRADLAARCAWASVRVFGSTGSKAQDDPFGREGELGIQPITPGRSPRTGLPSTIPSVFKPLPINTRDIEQVLTEILEREQTTAIRQLFNTWNAQADALKFEEVSNAIRDGQMSAAQFEEWQGLYAQHINETLDPMWRRVAQSAHEAMALSAATGLGTDVLPFANTLRRLNGWIERRGVELVKTFSDSQRLAVRNVLRHYTVDVPLPPRELGRFLRPIIGLTPREATAAQRLRDALAGEGLAPKAIEGRVQTYSAFLKQRRAERIARTEISFAHNRAALDAVRTLRDEGGLVAPVVKTWLTADDERVCPRCGPLDGTVIEIDQSWPTELQRPNRPVNPKAVAIMPPLHPNCRCTVAFDVMVPDGQFGEQPTAPVGDDADGPAPVAPSLPSG